MHKRPKSSPLADERQEMKGRFVLQLAGADGGPQRIFLGACPNRTNTIMSMLAPGNPISHSGRWYEKDWKAMRLFDGH